MPQKIHGYMSLELENSESMPDVQLLFLIYTNEEGVPTEILVLFSIEQLFGICADEDFRDQLVNPFSKEELLGSKELFKNIVEGEMLPPQSSETMVRVSGSFMRFIMIQLKESFGIVEDGKKPPSSPGKGSN